MMHQDERPLPPRAAMLELANSARRACRTALDQLKEFPAKGLNECFTGRHDELLRLEQIFETRGTKAHGALLYGPPGSGKSATKDYWRMISRTRNHAVVRVPAEAFASEARLRHELVQSDEWRAATALERAARTGGMVLGRDDSLAAEAVNAWAQSLNAGEIPPELVPLAAGLLQLAGKPNDTWQDCCEALNQTFSGGWTIAVDEAEDLDQYLDRDETRSMLKQIGDPSQRPDQLANGGLLLAGLSDTVKTVDDYRLTRLHRIRMGALDPQDAAHVIADAINRSELPRSIRTRIRGRWIRTLARDFHIWPHHTRCAAVGVQHIANHIEWRESRGATISDAELDEHLEEIRTAAATSAERLYNDRWGNATDQTNDLLPIDVVALADECNGVMHKSQLRKLIDHELAESGTEGHTADDWLRGLCRSGIIEPIIAADDDQTRGRQMIRSSHYHIPVPSMASHIQHHAGVAPNQEAVAAAKADIQPRSQQQANALIAHAKQRRTANPMTDDMWARLPIPADPDERLPPDMVPEHSDAEADK